jgi:hypothetical protein
MDETILQKLTTLLNDIEREYDIIPSAQSDPLQRLTYIIDRFATDEQQAKQQAQFTQRELRELRLKHDELILALQTVGKVFGLRTWDIEQMLRLKGKLKVERKSKRKR